MKIFDRIGKFFLISLMIFLAIVIGLRMTKKYGFLPNWWEAQINSNIIDYFILVVILLYVLMIIFKRKGSLWLGGVIIVYFIPNFFLWGRNLGMTGELIYLNHLILTGFCMILIGWQIYMEIRHSSSPADE